MEPLREPRLEARLPAAPRFVAAHPRTRRKERLLVHRPSVRATLIAIVVGASLTIGLLPLSVAGHEPPDIDPFLYGLGQTESSGRYDAENASSGAFGKYQIMPYNWGPWAAR
jgi:hypothetical protein